MSSAQMVEAAVMRALTTRGAKPEHITPGYDFIKAGVVDSLSLLGFTLSLEDTFRIRLTDEEVVSPGFRTYGGLCDLVLAKLEKAS